jgi:Ca2+-binding RTX toxin-like protein
LATFIQRTSRHILVRLGLLTLLALSLLAIAPTTRAGAAAWPKLWPKCHGQLATIVRGTGDDVIYDTPGKDVIVDLGGYDTIYLTKGNDVVCAGPGDDEIYLNPDWFWDGYGSSSQIYGEGGNDTIDFHTSQGYYTIDGGSGDDTIYGSLHPLGTMIDGNEDSDTIYGGPNDDQLYGGDGDDDLYGLGDHDILIGGLGADTLDGGPDSDVCSGFNDVSPVNEKDGAQDTAQNCELRFDMSQEDGDIPPGP